MDNELIKELEKIRNKKSNKEESLEEHSFIANCLSVGLRIEDLKNMEHKDIMKILLCFYKENQTTENKTREATQSDWEALAR